MAGVWAEISRNHCEEKRCFQEGMFRGSDSCLICYLQPSSRVGRRQGERLLNIFSAKCVYTYSRRIQREALFFFFYLAATLVFSCPSDELGVWKTVHHCKISVFCHSTVTLVFKLACCNYFTDVTAAIQYNIIYIWNKEYWLYWLKLSSHDSNQ